MRWENLLKPEAYIFKAQQALGILPAHQQPTYAHDGMHLYGKNLAFLSDPKFKNAYRAGMAAHLAGDLQVEFRMHVELWAASQCAILDGDFVCCGVNTGIFPLAICEYIDFNATGKSYWLFDTYAGIPEEQMSATESDHAKWANVAFYSDVYDLARRNFAPYPKATLVRGLVPDTLATVEIGKVSYLQIDMNIAYPERAAIEYFWPKLVPGALVVFDDYAFAYHGEQQQAIDEFAKSAGVSVLTLPTGQGLLKKP